MSSVKPIIPAVSARQIDALLKFDPLAAAEDITGTSTHDPDSPAMALGFVIAGQHSEAKREALLATGDTTFCSTLEYYQSVITNAGFELCLEEPFVRTKPELLYADEPMEDRYFVYAHRDGFLLAFDTYRNVDVNGGKLWYNWRPGDIPASRYGVTSSGGFRDYDDPKKRVWVGDHDCREAILHNIAMLKAHGTILPKWAYRHGSLWLLDGQDWREGYEGNERTESHTEFNERANRITDRRLGQCPQWVQDMVGTRNEYAGR